VAIISSFAPRIYGNYINFKSLEKSGTWNFLEI